MTHYRFDVIIIGGGPGGATAAGVLAGTGLSVAVLEAGAYAGAENWSGCVYFAESLAAEDCFGARAVEAAPFERKVFRRGTLVHNGIDVVGLELDDPSVFRHSYTVLRPVYDPYFINVARTKGAMIFPETTVLSLIRASGRVVGVETNRGPLHAEVVFIAEGDASHLVRSEGLERKERPHFLQGVKAVLNLPPEVIEQRFGISRCEGAAYEILLRNASIGGRTARLNVGGFLYTNRDSLSLGYVVPLDNLAKHYRGGHDVLFEWMRGLPYLRDLVGGGRLSAYGTKIIRSGGWRERPVLVEDGLAVGGASAGLGIDIPFPNFTGPASATGLYFGRAVKALLTAGKSLTAKNLAKAYVEPLRESAYGKNAKHLSAWPNYFGRSSVLFGRTADIACGAARFLSFSGPLETGRFLRGHLLSPKAVKESLVDTMRSLGALRLWKPLAATLLNPVTVLSWFRNLFPRRTTPSLRLKVILQIGGREIDVPSLLWPVGGLVGRLTPALSRALGIVYANDNVPMDRKLRKAVSLIIRSFRLTDLIVLPVFGVLLGLTALGTAVWDAFRFYILKTPVERFLKEPVMAYSEAQRKARNLDAVRPEMSLDAKLATNTYRLAGSSHIRTVWPDAAPTQPDMARAGLWWVCPARVYLYDAPSLGGRGSVTVNYENCIKCESCWRAEPVRALWGRHTEHRLVYRPDTAAIDELISPSVQSPYSPASPSTPSTVDEKIWYFGERLVAGCKAALAASRAFQQAVELLPASTDAGRRSWPERLGRRLVETLRRLEDALTGDTRPGLAADVRFEREEIERRIAQGRLFHALYGCRRLDTRLRLWSAQGPCRPSLTGETAPTDRIAYEDVISLFPDRVVKEWEESSIPDEWKQKLRSFVASHHTAGPALLRPLASASPALALIAAHHLAAMDALDAAGMTVRDDVCVIAASDAVVTEEGKNVRVRAMVTFAPLTAARAVVVLSGNKGVLVPLDIPGVKLAPAPAIGFRASGLTEITLDCAVLRESVLYGMTGTAVTASAYLAIALGAVEYLARRAKEHATGRVQFPGQMLDTGGRDGIAKLGAVKAMIARIEAWRVLLETLHGASSGSASLAPHSTFDLLCSTVSAIAFGPEPWAASYNAGQVFGGFAYSEDDLLSRFYRDSSLFRFLAPGQGAAALLNDNLHASELESLFGSAFGTLSMIVGEPLAPLVERWRDLARGAADVPSTADPSALGEAKAMLVGLRAVLVRIEQGLRQGRSDEEAAACAEVLLAQADDALSRARMSAGRGGVQPFAALPLMPEGTPAKLDDDYDRFCAAPGRPHTSGLFLLSVFDRSPRFVPEVQLHDTKLRQRWQELAEWFRANCRDRTYDGLAFERYVEKIHGLPDEVIESVKKHAWLATYVPQELDGLGWRKAEYYILNQAAGMFGDAGICLLIMASTSIGTTPVLLGLEDELGRVREELAPLAKDPKALGEIGSRLKRLVRSFSAPNPGWIKKEYTAIMSLVDRRIRKTRVVKYLAANFLKSFYAGGIAGRSGDFGGFTSGLTKASELFDRLVPDVTAALAELPRRERAHKLFLRNLGHGGVSAFALTEPTAGSDSGGVKTTAKPVSTKLNPLPDGRYVFFLAEGDEKIIRYLIDADRVEFTDSGMAYRTPDGTIAPISYAGYDHAASKGARSYNHNGKSCVFHDIGQVRQPDICPMYEYYVLTGAKMWITNGSAATQFALYAQSPEGVTGFMVDRYSEGLTIGADEKKTGQRGSPTNELAIDSVRVPRENVIGYEGHGQVNALETLNVGRCGLAVVSTALMRKLLDEARRNVSSSPDRDRLLGEAAAVLFGSESLAYFLVGLFDRPYESVRMESAIAKYVCSEDIHGLISLLEQAYGPAGQTEKHLIEKARRDSRVLTIYEGTNEVQRFLILKDLIAQAADWPRLPEYLSERPNDAVAVLLAKWKNRLRNHVVEAARVLGDTAWTDAMLQPALFPLAEMSGEILRLECVYHRTEWLEKRRTLLAGQTIGDNAAYADVMIAAGGRAAERAVARLSQLDRVFTHGWSLVARNLSLGEVVAADAALDRFSRKQGSDGAGVGVLSGGLRVLCILRPMIELSPSPRLIDNRAAELVWKAEPLDSAALSRLRWIAACAGSGITVDVLMPGRKGREDLLRNSAGAGMGLYRLDAATSDVDAIADAVDELERERKYDLIVTGALSRSDNGRLAAWLAGRLARPYSEVDDLTVSDNGSGFAGVPARAVVAITEGEGSLSEIDGAVASQLATVKVVGRVREISQALFERPGGGAVVTKTVTTPAEAAEYLASFATAMKAATAEDYTGAIKAGDFAAGDAVWALLDPSSNKSNVAVLRTGRVLADARNRQSRVLIAAPKDLWPSLLGLAKANGADAGFCIDTGGNALSEKGTIEILRLLMKASGDSFFIVGTTGDTACALVGGEASLAGKRLTVISGASSVSMNGAGALVLKVPVYDGKLMRRAELRDSAGMITMLAEAELPAAEARPSFSALSVALDVKPEWVTPLPPAAGPTLSQAEVIIDVGYGVKDRAGFGLAEELRKKLEALGIEPVLGATRKVTQDLKLLPLEAQIGQTGVSVNPRIIIALGVSGAPQHIDWVGSRAEILCFNKDVDAPLMKLNQTRPAPRVHPIPGDLFVTVKELLKLL
jgi:electron transfer flavoprotein-quinone oxidoreductase